MPIEVVDKEEFLELSRSASECKVKRNRDNTKLKLRTGRYLYTIKLEAGEAEELISKLGCPTVQI
jgi:large subunit ribosomal protein L38e